MRYRPFGTSGAAVSCISLVLTDQPMRPEERVKLIYGALEAGINTFELQSRDPEVASALGEALSAVERRMVFVAQRIGWSRDPSGKRVRDLGQGGLTGAIEMTLQRSRLGRLDVALIDVADGEVLPPHVVPAMQSAKQAGRVRLLGVAGRDGVDQYLDSGEFDVLATSFNIQSGWRERNRLKRAVQAEIPIIGYGYQPFTPAQVEDAPKSSGPLGLGRLFGGGNKEPKPQGAYAFLDRAPGTWTPEEICLGYALTEPSLTTVLTRVRDVEHLQRLAAVAEKELPTGVAAQIEMARVSASQESGAA
jgi:aryl-alcohol dehydrogenase-like predicted oxidoreductase